MSSGSVIVRRSATRLIQYDQELPTELVESLYETPERLVEVGKLLRSRGARRTVRFQWAGADYVLKHYVEPSWRHALKQSVHRSRARASYFASHALARSGVATPRPVAFVENRWGPLRRDSYLMYPYVEGRTLRECLAEQSKTSASAQLLWRQLAEVWQLLQRLQVSLADANLGNFIVAPDRALWVIDIDKTRFHRIAYFARRRQQRSWRQVLRSAARSGIAA